MTTNEKNRESAQKRRPHPEQSEAAKSARRPVRRGAVDAPAAAREKRSRNGQAGSATAEKKRPRRPVEPDTNARTADQMPQMAERSPSASNAPEQVWKPTREESRFAEDAPRNPKPARQRRPAATAQADSGYQPYRQANRRKKSARKSARKKFFSAENPLIAGISGGIRKYQEAQAKKREAQAKKRNTPAVIYTDPVPFNRDRLIVQLLTVVAVALALTLCMSIFFKVKTITVTGAEVYSPWSIREASGIQEGDNLLSFGIAKASGQIIANLPYVKSVRIGIKLPDTVNIEVQEESVVYSVASDDGIWWLMDSQGKVVEMTTETGAEQYTKVLGVTLSSPKVGEAAVAAEEAAQDTTADTAADTAQDDTATDTTAATEANDPLADGLTTVSVTGAERLQVALEILTALESNDIVGDAASVDVTDLEEIVLWYGNRYQVNLGDSSQLEYKIACMNDSILQLSEYESGILDVSFRTWTTQVGYTRFQ